MDRARAFDHCRRITRLHRENFPVGSLLLPPGLRRHIHALYAYARTVDDLGDEAPGDRLALLQDWERELRLCYGGTPSHPVFRALRQTIRTFDIPIEPFLRLIEANRMDQTRSRWETMADLMRYCEFSANPCGHLVLYVFGYRDAFRRRLADATCTALQLTNFWQDIGADYRRGRVYIPQEDLRAFGVPEEELGAERTSPRLRALLRLEVERTRRLFEEGARLARHVRGRLRFDILMFTRAGLEVLREIERRDGEVLAERVELSAWGRTRSALGALLAWA